MPGGCPVGRAAAAAAWPTSAAVGICAPTTCAAHAQELRRHLRRLLDDAPLRRLHARRRPAAAAAWPTSAAARRRPARRSARAAAWRPTAAATCSTAAAAAGRPRAAAAATPTPAAARRRPAQRSARTAAACPTAATPSMNCGGACGGNQRLRGQRVHPRRDVHAADRLHSRAVRRHLRRLRRRDSLRPLLRRYALRQ